MTQRCAVQKRLLDAANALPIACAVLFLSLPPQSMAQDSAKSPAATREASGATGAIIVPPATDPGMTRQAPPVGDPRAVKPPPMPVDPDAVRKPANGKDASELKGKAGRPDAKHEAAPQGNEQHRAKDSCQGPAELCKQDSAR